MCVCIHKLLQQTKIAFKLVFASWDCYILVGSTVKQNAVVSTLKPISKLFESAALMNRCFVHEYQRF